MNRVPVLSSTLSSVSYFPDQALLEIEFHAGEIYRYFGVSPRTYNDLLEAESKGRYFNSKIRNRFPYQQIPRSLQTQSG